MHSLQGSLLQTIALVGFSWDLRAVAKFSFLFVSINISNGGGVVGFGAV
jgi:hypothetical protein